MNGFIVEFNIDKKTIVYDKLNMYMEDLFNRGNC